MLPKSNVRASTMICIGHRGAAGHAAENTLSSVRKAIELGAACIEVDVYCVDRRLIVFHDNRLERMTDGAGYLCQQSIEGLRRLTIGNDERIPTLAEVFEAINLRAGINIELKGPAAADGVAEFIAGARRRGWTDDLILVSSFDHRQLARVRELDDRIKIGAVLKGLPVDDAAFAEKLGAYSVHPGIEFIDARFVNDAHARGLRVFVFTANHPDDIARMRSLGVDGVFSDFPERVLEGSNEADGLIGWR